MKLKLIYIILPLYLLASCSSEDYDSPLQLGSEALQLSVRAGNFVTDGAPDTRATDSGNATIFEDGDRIGITVLDNSSNVLYNNIPYKYNGSTWSFDNNNGEGKTAIYYDNKAGTLTYLAYFPYSAEADNARSKTDLKAKFQPLSDQRSKDAYRTSDLLVWSNMYSSTLPKKLEIAFSHAYSSLSLSPSIKRKINGADISYTTTSVSDVSFTIGAEPLFAHQADDGSYRIILSPQNTAARWLCAYSGARYSGTMLETNLAENTRYTLAPVLKDFGEYALKDAKAGDFYCRNESGEGYLIPGDGISILSPHKCVGLVFYAGKNSSDKSDYSTRLAESASALPSGTVHGYAMALTNVSQSGLAWEYRASDQKSDQRIGTSTSGDDWNGYNNQQIIHTFVAANKDWQMSDFPAANGCELYGTSDESVGQKDYAAPSNSSGWFLPSAGQLVYLYNNRGDLSARINKIKEVTGDGNIKWIGNYSWSSSEAAGYDTDRQACVMYSGEINHFSKNDRNSVRAVCVF